MPHFSVTWAQFFFLELLRSLILGIMYFGTCLFRSTQPWGMIDVCDFVLFFNDISFKTFLRVVPQCYKHLILPHVSDFSLQSGHRNTFWLMCHCWANEYDFTLINTKCACRMTRVGPQRSSLGIFIHKSSPQCSSHSLGTSYFFQSGLFSLPLASLSLIFQTIHMCM